MQVYVVVSRAMNTVNAIALFSTRDKAETFLRNNNTISDEVEVWNIRGEYEYPSELYIANQYEPLGDVMFSEGVYANYEQAKKAAGERGHVLSVQPDSR